MTEQNDSARSALETMLAARRFTRRTLLKGAVAAGALTIAGPALVRNARSSSGELNLLMWSDEFPDPVIPNFAKASGIKVNQTPFSQNEEQINKLQATGGEGFDLCQPTRDRAPQFKDLGVLAPFDMNKLKNAATYSPRCLKVRPACGPGTTASITCRTWGSEAISWRTDKWTSQGLSYGSLWEDDVKGHVQGRPHSLLLGIGLWMDGNGTLPTNRMLDSFKDPDSFKKIYDKILPFAIEHKPWIKQFWDSADNTKSGLMENDVWIGQTWDGPPLTLKKDGKPVPIRRRRKARSPGSMVCRARRRRTSTRSTRSSTISTRRKSQPPLPKARATIRSSPVPMRFSPTWPRRTSRKPIRAMR